MTISLAIIVKDAEKTIEKCLETFKEAVDEIVVVDTGSTDGTVDIVKKYTENIHHFEWINDFSAARNYSFDKCTKDFILWADADDYILPEDVKKIRELDLSDKEIVICHYEYAHDENGVSICTVPRERIVKRSLGLKWEKRIHEYIPMSAKMFISDIRTHHNKQHGSSERNLKMLEEIVLEDPNDARNQYYLGKEFADFGRTEEAIKYLNIFLDNPHGWWEDKYAAHQKIAQCYLTLKDEPKFLKHIFESVRLEERRAEPYYFLGNFYMGKQQYDKAILWFETCLTVERPKELLATYQPEYYTWLPALQLCVCYNAVGNVKKAYESNKKVLEYRSNDARALNNDKILLEALKKTDVKDRKDGEGKKLNLGCGGKMMAGYVNVDLFKGPTVDEVFGFDKIPYEDETISGINSEHSLEHVPFEKTEEAIKEWNRVLVPGGELMLYIPDFELCCRSYLNAPIEHTNFFNSKCWFKNTIYGIQRSQAGEPDEAQIHKSGYSKSEIKLVLERNNFIVDYLGNYPSDDFLLPKDLRLKPSYYTPSMAIRAVKPVSNLKIGWISAENWEGAQTRIRVLNVNRNLRTRGYRSHIVNYQDILNENFDVAIVGKGIDEHHFKNIRMLKRAGKTVYADCCESLFEFPWFKEILEICDKVICCSYALEEQVKAVNPNTMVIEDAWE